jgi:putative glycosyltransferase (TIGR04372 family)
LPENKIANRYLRYKLIDYVNLNFYKTIVNRKEYLNNSFSKLIIYSLPRIFKSCKNIYFANSDRGPRLSKNIFNYKIQKSLIFEELGIKKGNYICIYARDDKYLNSLSIKRNWDYHRYRNSNIDNLRLLSEWIIDNQKLNIVRIGSSPEKRISWLKKDGYKIIDYPFSNLRSEENDIELISNCNLYVSNGGGPEAVAIAARREMIKINQVPLGDDVGYNFGLWLPKTHINNKSKNYLSLIEICELNIEFAFNSNDFERMEISLKENTPLEILNLFQDYIKFKTGKFSDEEKFLIHKYNKIRKKISKKWGILKSNKNFIAPSFLKKYKNLLEY